VQQIVHDAVAHLLCQRQQRLPPVLAGYAERGRAPVDVGKTQLHHVARAQTHPRQQQQNGPVPFADRRSGIRAGQDVLDLFRQQVARQRR